MADHAALPATPQQIVLQDYIDLAQIGALKQTAEEPACRGRDHDAVGLGQDLEPGSQVRGLADDRLLLRSAAAEQVAHHHEPGRDADPGLQRGPGRRGQPAHRRHELEAGPHRPLGVVLVRRRVAEVGQHAVAHVLGDEAAEAFHVRRDAAVVGADHLAQILGAEAADTGSEADPQALPKEIGRLAALRAKLDAARQRLEAQAKVRAAAERADYEAKVAVRESRTGRAKGKHPKPPDDTPEPHAQSNLSDPDSRLMRKSKSHEYRQAYNAQAVVDAEGSQLILGARVSQCASDRGELVATIEAIPASVGRPEMALADGEPRSLSAPKSKCQAR